MIASNKALSLALSLGLSLAFGACFGGEFVQGLPCTSDADCGPEFECIEGVCGGLGDQGVCGNGLLDADEICDDGNTQNGDGCSANCNLCGNGVIEPDEQCDDANTEDGDSCTPACGIPGCGDGFLAAGEACDDGNEIGTDGCTPACALPACGDGFVNVAGETCDDGNLADLDGCTPACTTAPDVPVLELSFSQVKQFDFSWDAVAGGEYYQLFESEDVGADFEQVGADILAESISLEMPLHFRVQASYKLRACNADGCSESAVVDVVGNLAEAVGYFKASNTQADDTFGESVALSGDGNTLAIGAPGESSSAIGIDGDQTDDSALAAGAVYVFVHDAGVWSQQAYIKASNTESGDAFGIRVALSDNGDTLAVGASQEASSATGIDGNQNDNSAAGAGAAYVFVRNDGAWSQQAYLKASNTSPGHEFGFSVMLSATGDTLAVGAWYEDSAAIGIDGNGADNSAYQAGAAYVFVRNSGLWSQQAYVKASNTGTTDRFGRDVALSANGDTLVVGAFGERSSATGIDGDQTDDSAPAAGAVYVFVRSNAIWSQEAYVKASNPDTNDYFGRAVALSADGDTMAVGAWYEDSAATGIDGDQSNNAADHAGAVYVFVRDTGVWSQQAYVKASNTGSNDEFGRAVALSAEGDIMAVSAQVENGGTIGIGGNEADNSATNAGAVYVFVREGEAWSQSAYVKASNTDMGDYFGHDVALSTDGLTLAVGAYLEASSAIDIGGDQADDSALNAGAVYIY